MFSRSTNDHDEVTFDELVAAECDALRANVARHYEHPKRALKEVEGTLATSRSGFERDQGEIEEEFWAYWTDAGIALTERKGRGGQVRLHRSTQYLLGTEVDFAEIESKLAIRAIKARHVLRGVTQRVMFEMIFTALARMLAHLDATRYQPPTEEPTNGGESPPPPTTTDGGKRAGDQKILKWEEEQIREIDAFYAEAASRQAQLTYVHGMIAGVLALLVIGGSAVAGLWATGELPGSKSLFAAMIGGGLGAVLSVLSRMSSGKLQIHHDVGPSYIGWLGGIRPLLGAAFAVALYYAIRGEVVPIEVKTGTSDIAFYFAIGFLAGFSERWVKDVLHVAEQDLTPAPQPRQTGDQQS